MPNDCYNRVTIGGNPEVIDYLYKKRFKFNTILPIPDNAHETWCLNNWGTTGDRYKFKVLKVGREGLQISFHTKWNPPYNLFNYLCETFRIWLKCEWDEEGGAAGVYIVKFNNETKNTDVQNFQWEDWCIEEYCHRFTH